MRGNLSAPQALIFCVHYSRHNKREVGERRGARLHRRPEVFAMTRRYIVLVMLSALAIAVFAAPLGGLWDFPTAQPRTLLVFRMQEGLAVVPAQ